MLGYESMKRAEAVASSYAQASLETFTSSKTLKMSHHHHNPNQNSPAASTNELNTTSTTPTVPVAKSFESLFETFIQANSSKSISRAFDQICKHLKINPKQVFDNGYDLTHSHPNSNAKSSPSSQFISNHRAKSYSLLTGTRVNGSSPQRQAAQQGVPPPNYTRLLYRIIKAKTNYWKANELWKKYDKRANLKDYFINRNSPAFRDVNILIVGCGPVGLRLAIECALLGLRCTVVEKRDRFSRNNVVHLWPFTITDLKSLGAKLFYGKFCAGSIDHISE
jgi:hypothetical protein